MITKELKVTVAVGLHARPANEFAEIAKSAPFEIVVSKAGGAFIRAHSPLRLLTLKAKQGEIIVVGCDTQDLELANEYFLRLEKTISE